MNGRLLCYVRGFTQLPQKRKAATYFEGPGGHGRPLLAGSYVTQRVRLAYSKPGTSKKIPDLVYSDRRIQVEEIAQALGISHGSVSTILHDRLGMRKLTARWVPKSLSDEQMATTASVCSALLKCFSSKDDFFFMSGDCR